MEEKLKTKSTINNVIVIPASQGGFDKVFIKRNLWYPVKMGANRIDVLQYIAVYRLAPISAVTHYAEISAIKPLINSVQSNMYVIEIKPGTIKELPQSITRGEKVGQIQYLKYSSLEKILAAKTTDDL